jgi:hypothetical protein
MATAADLIANPTRFMRAHLLMVTSAAGALGGQRNFTFRQTNAYRGVNLLGDGAPMEVYSLVPSGNGAPGEPVTAWWCPYSAGQALGAVLPGAGGPSMMFTPVMDGCTFAAGSVNPNGDVLVYHVNATGVTSGLGRDATDEQKGELQRWVQREVARDLVPNGKIIDPDDYYVPDKAIVAVPQGAKITTVTFGRRSANSGWRFYTHQWFTVEGRRDTLNFMGTKLVI